MLGWLDPNFPGNFLRAFDSADHLLEEVELTDLGPTQNVHATWIGFRRPLADIARIDVVPPTVVPAGQPLDNWAIDNIYYNTTTTVPPVVPPSIESLEAAQDGLWPPNGKMVSIPLAVSASGSPAPVFQIVSVSSNELPTVPGPEWVVTGPLAVNLRADRAGSGLGRVYAITVACTNAGGTASKTVTVTVPHDKGK